jgi:hypothetical protein
LPSAAASAGVSATRGIGASNFLATSRHFHRPPPPTGQFDTEGVPPGPPEGVPPSYSGTENPGVPHRPGTAGTRSLAREQCQEFKQNFGDNKSQFGRCIADLAKALHGSAAPGRACSDMSRKPDENEHRSDFSACVAAAAQALRER